MNEEFFPPETYAKEWADKICSRLATIGVSESEIKELKIVIHNFTVVAIQDLSQNRSIKLPHNDSNFDIDSSKANQIIDVFLRGLTHAFKKLRETGKSWVDRKQIMEKIAWKLFNLSKLLVSFMYLPAKEIGIHLKSEKEVHIFMRQSTEAIYREEVDGIPAILPFN